MIFTHQLAYDPSKITGKVHVSPLLILSYNLFHILAEITNTNTQCPTRHRSRNFFNNSNTNKDCNEIWKGVGSLSSHFVHNEVSPLQISLQYTH